MRKIILGTVAALALSGTAFAGASDSHTVTVQVDAINEIAVAGDVTLTIDSAVAGSEPIAATDSTATLAWTTNEVSRKITVATDLATPVYALTVDATGVAGGTTAGVVTLSTTAQDFVTAISETTGNATLAYSATATAADGTGNEVNTVTYTILSSL